MIHISLERSSQGLYWGKVWALSDIFSLRMTLTKSLYITGSPGELKHSSRHKNLPLCDKKAVLTSSSMKYYEPSSTSPHRVRYSRTSSEVWSDLTKTKILNEREDESLRFIYHLKGLLKRFKLVKYELFPMSFHYALRSRSLYALQGRQES